jgi:hypothetical protein
VGHVSENKNSYMSLWLENLTENTTEEIYKFPETLTEKMCKSTEITEEEITGDVILWTPDGGLERGYIVYVNNTKEIRNQPCKTISMENSYHEVSIPPSSPKVFSVMGPKHLLPSSQELDPRSLTRACPVHFTSSNYFLYMIRSFGVPQSLANCFSISD